MKFVIRKNGNILKSYNNFIEFVSLRNDYFSAIINDRTVTNCLLEIDGEEYDVKSLHKLVVDVKYVGRFYFFYYKDCSLERFTEKIQELKLIDSSKKDNIFRKIEALLKATNNKYLSFVLFYGCVEGYNIIEPISLFYQNNCTQLFIVKQKYIDEDIINKKTIPQFLILYPFRWLAIFFGGIIMFLSLLLAITYTYYGNIIASSVLFFTSIFSLICLSIGNCDMYRKNDKKPERKEIFMCMTIDAISLSAGLGAFTLIFQFVKKEEILLPFISIAILSMIAAILYLSLLLLFGYIRKCKVNKRIIN